MVSVLPKDYTTWSIDQVGIWLKNINLERYVSVFKLLEVDGQCLKVIIPSDLESNEFGILPVHRRKIMEQINLLKSNLTNQSKPDSNINSNGLTSNPFQISVKKESKKFILTEEKKEFPQKNDGNQILPLELVIISDSQSSEKIKKLNQAGGTIGRNGSFWKIEDNYVSSNHALIEYLDNSYFIKDMGSSYGTYIIVRNEVRVMKDMIFQVADLEFLVEKLDYIELHPECQLFFYAGYLNNQRIQIGKNGGIISKKQAYYEENANIPVEEKLITFRFTNNVLKAIPHKREVWMRLTKPKNKSMFGIKLNVNDKIKLGALEILISDKSNVNTNLHTESKREIAKTNSNQNPKCKICNKNIINIVFLPCNHVVCCSSCADYCVICPLCGVKLTAKGSL